MAGCILLISKCISDNFRIDQATDRAYRIGQKRTVYSVKLITKGTIEEKVLEMQKKKQAVIDATVESDEAMISSMTWNDVQELLDL